MIILYTHDADLVSAQLIQQQYGGTLVKKPYGSGVYHTTQDLILIGGQYTNDTYKYWMDLGYLQEITSADAGDGFVQTFEFQGKNIYALAGWNRIDTVTAVSLVMKYGLPDSSYKGQSPQELSLVTFDYEGVIPTEVANKLGQIANYINDKASITQSGEVMWYGIRENRYLEFLFAHNPIDLMAGLIILAIVAVCGIVFWFTGKILITKVETGARIDELEADAEYNQKMIDMGFSTEQAIESKNQVYDSFNKGLASDVEKILKAFVYSALIGSGVYVGLKYGIPAIQKIAKK